MERRPSYDQQLVVVLSSAIRSSPTDAVTAILSAESFAKEVNQLGPLGASALHLAAWRNHWYAFGSFSVRPQFHSPGPRVSHSLCARLGPEPAVTFSML